MKITWPGFYLCFVLVAVAPLALLSLAGLAGAFSASRQQIKDYGVETVDDAEVETAEVEAKYLGDLAKELARPYQDQQCAELPDSATSELKVVNDTWDGSFGELRALLTGGTGVLAEDPSEATKEELGRISGELKGLADKLRDAKASGVGGIERLTQFVQKRQDTVGDYICIKDAEELFARGTPADYESCAKTLQDHEWSDSKAEGEAQRLLKRANFEAKVIKLTEEIINLPSPPNDSWEQPLKDFNDFLTFEFPKSPDPAEQKRLDELSLKLRNIYAERKARYDIERFLKLSLPLDQRLKEVSRLVNRFPESKNLRDYAREEASCWLKEEFKPRRTTVDANLKQVETVDGDLLVGVFEERLLDGRKYWVYWKTIEQWRNAPTVFVRIDRDEIKGGPAPIVPTGCIDGFNEAVEDLQLESNLTRKGGWEMFRDECDTLQEDLDDYRKRSQRDRIIEDFDTEKGTAERIIELWDADIRPLLAG